MFFPRRLVSRLFLNSRFNLSLFFLYLFFGGSDLMRKQLCSLFGKGFLASAVIALFLSANSWAANIQLYSWESGLEGWSAANATVTADGVLGVTNGLQAFHINALTPGFKNQIGFSGNIVSGPVFDALNNVGTSLQGGATDITLEFDLAIDKSLVTANGFGQISLFMNSTGVGFKEYSTSNFIGGNVLTSFPQMSGSSATDGATIVSSGNDQYHVTVPLGPTVTIGPGTFFQIGFKSNGGWTGTMELGIDNMTVNG